MFEQIKNAVVALVIMTLLTGVAYPLVVTGVAQLAFNHQANGSLLADGRGSELIGQPFTDPASFWSRPSGTSPAYNAGASSGTNLAPTNPALVDNVKSRIALLHEAAGTDSGPIPVDLVTASGSGLDPHISPAAAEYQVARVARARGLPEARVRELVSQLTESPTLGVLGEPRVNVVLLNRGLAGAATQPSATAKPLNWRALGFLP